MSQNLSKEKFKKAMLISRLLLTLTSTPPTDVRTMTRYDNWFVRFWRKVYNPLGFKKGYNFPLFFIFGGAMLGFSLARISYLNISGDAPSSFKTGAVTGEWFWYQSGIHRVGITLHLTTIVPAGVLMVFQFVPIIRYKAILFHRINGYLIIILATLGNIGAIMIARRAFGGTLATQSAVGYLVIATTIFMALAYYNIKRLQIDQHRAWMLRAMFALGTIITLRIIMALASGIISSIGSYSTVINCGEIEFIYANSPAALQSRYPTCVGGNNTDVVVKADINSPFGEEQKASMVLTFGMAWWVAIAMHAVGVEVYLRLTAAEGERLRGVSCEMQRKAGMRSPGSAGLTGDRLGDVGKWEAPRETA
ncbi:hypothetical protein VE01_03121 [Pseudogymnoascus verrucosus]|uniref:Microtubule associated protein n=1 Tax=Pseudogymnoascus verrucosus TaxID=342668 RepID=A0A1B8GRC8_9PEZI|nr:uncharacterized protein VE01_03121 [Pseudogymnoascus verrucosus]OBT98385.1 hypothetical protein VE01_03121 [Pseudogymnoascus verrucosus]